MSALSLQRVSVTLGGAPILWEITFDVAPGEWCALIGPNGAGKTTTLRAIAGLVPHDGSVRIAGVDAARLRRRERARRVAVVPQIPTTPQDMAVRDYVLLGRTPHTGYFGGTGASDDAATDRALERLELGDLARRALGTLSGGERQRAVLARALAQEAEVILLDEPTSALDLAHQQHVLELVDRLRREDGLAVIAAMHDLSAVSLYAGQIHLLARGALVASGDARTLLRAELLSETYGTPVKVFEHDGQLVVAPVRQAVRA
jgi:iron complex transport system ATP-binding protein